MKRSYAILLLLVLLMAALDIHAQGEQRALYDPSLDGNAEITKLVKMADANGKHVLLQVGGNW